MAQSPTHKLGQFIGDLVERSLREPLEGIARRHDLYLDYKHRRAARSGKSKVSWADFRGNFHDLDYVLEAGGSEDVLGRPKAFIEIAYRRYTKHSRNKAQEMQGAIVPLAETYATDRPFLGAILAGVFTQGSIAQLRSHGFGVLYFPFESIVAAFRDVGIDVYFEESSSDRQVNRQVRACAKLSDASRTRVTRILHQAHVEDVEVFLRALDVALARKVASVFIVALHGRSHEFGSLDAAKQFVQSYDEASAVSAFCRYEVHVRFSNGDEIRGTFASKIDAIRFLDGLE